MAKKRIGFVTSSILLKTGFSTNARCLLPYLWKKNKYTLFHLNQGLGQTPDFGRFPWKNDAALVPGLFDQGRFQSDPGYQRDVSYGNLAVEKFIIDNKLDYLILAEDPWAFSPDFYYKSRWWEKMKGNVLLWTTVDSLPVLPLVKEWLQNCPNIWFWASFGVRTLQQEDPTKYKHLKWVYGALDSKEWIPISQKEKLELRQKNNIDPDLTIFLQLGRNQLRKLYPSTLETFAKFKRQYPEHKAKLHFHCSYSDHGFPLERLTLELGLKKEDVLTTYFCRTCPEWEIKPFVGEDQNCRYCGGQKTQITAGVTSTISNKELSKIMGVSDACVSVYTSGGYEYVNSQSLLCELPLLCTEYSSGEDFVNQDFVTRLDGAFTYEVQTGFKKHVPNINTMVKFYNKICEMSPEKRKEIGRRGRDWALKTFDVEVIGRKLEEWIDNAPSHNWDFSPVKVELKDPNAVIPETDNNEAWVKSLYNNILKCEPDPQGFRYWLDLLKNGAKKDEMIKTFRGIAHSDNQKLGQTQEKTLEKLLDDTGRKRFLIVLKESIGDIINSLSLLDSFKESYPNHDLYYACDPAYFEILDGQTMIHKVIAWQPQMDSEIMMTGQGDNPGCFDAYCNLAIGSQKILNYLSHHKIALQLI